MGVVWESGLEEGVEVGVGLDVGGSEDEGFVGDVGEDEGVDAFEVVSGCEFEDCELPDEAAVGGGTDGEGAGWTLFVEGDVGGLKGFGAGSS